MRPSPLPALMFCGAILALGVPAGTSEGGLSQSPDAPFDIGVPQGVGPATLPRRAPAARTAGTENDRTLTVDVAARTPSLASPVGPGDIPAAALDAYRSAAAVLAQAAPDCRLSWTLLAAIGRVESDHGRFAGSVLGLDGVSRPAILGVPLTGAGPVAEIRDTDGGLLDGDDRWDRAVGPMQFLPGTWELVGTDGDGDGRRSPHDLDDAALAAGVYLCAGASGLDRTVNMRAAVLRYNHSASYATTVLSYELLYRRGEFAVSSPPLLAAHLAAAPVDLLVPTEALPESPSRPTNPHVVSPARPRPLDDGPRSDDPSSPRPVSPSGPGREAPHQRPGTNPDDSGESPTPTGAAGGSQTPEAAPPGAAADHSSTGPDPRDPEQLEQEQTSAPTGEREPVDQAPAEGPSPEDSSGQAADPGTAADPTEETALEGIWRHCEEDEEVPDFCLDHRRLLLGPPELLVIDDLDGDGHVVTPRDELDTVVGRAVRVRVLSSADGWVLVALVLLPADAPEGGGSGS